MSRVCSCRNLEYLGNLLANGRAAAIGSRVFPRSQSSGYLGDEVILYNVTL
jgi:hypothetical protein